MDSSDEDFLPNPNRSRKRRRPPDHSEASGSGQRTELDEPDNQQRGLILHDDFNKGRCFFIFLCVSAMIVNHKIIWNQNLKRWIL